MALTLKKRFKKRFFRYYTCNFSYHFFKTFDRVYRSSRAFKSKV